MNGKAGFILLHGAGLGSWIWKDVQPLLRLPAIAADFPERNKSRVSPKLGLNDYAAHVILQAERLESEKMILVAHSVSGLIAMKLAKHFGKRVAGFVAVSASIPKENCNFYSTLPLPQRFVVPLAVKLLGTRPPEKRIRETLCNDLHAVPAEEVVRRFVAESPRLFSEPCDAAPPDTKKVYIETSADNSNPQSNQLKMAHNLSADRMISMRAGHLPMLGYPKEVAEYLNDFAVQV